MAKYEELISYDRGKFSFKRLRNFLEVYGPQPYYMVEANFNRIFLSGRRSNYQLSIGQYEKNGLHSKKIGEEVWCWLDGQENDLPDAE